MLEVEYKGTERFTRLSTLEVVAGILRGEIEKDTLARRCDPDWSSLREEVEQSPTGDANIPSTHQTVEELVDLDECALLSDWLLIEVQRFYTANSGRKPETSGDSPAPGNLVADLNLLGEPLGLHRLCKRIAQLAEWKWPSSELQFRVMFLRAWLHELVGETSKARDYYEAYLQLVDKNCSQIKHTKDPLQQRFELQIEPALTLLALNNFAVLNLRTGGLLHLAANPKSVPLKIIVRLTLQRLLPGACLSLMNLVDLAWRHKVATGDDAVFEAIGTRLFSEALLLRKLLYGEQIFTPAAKQPATSSDPASNPPAEPKKESKPAIVNKPQPKLAAAHNYWVPLITNICTIKDDMKKALGQAAEANTDQKSVATPAPAGQPNEVDSAKILKLEESLDRAWRAFILIGAKLAHRGTAEVETEIVKELELWPSQTSLLFAAPPPKFVALDDWEATAARHLRYAEAVSVLYPRDLGAVASNVSAETGTAKPQKVSSPARPQGSELEVKVRQMFENGNFDAAERYLDQGGE